MSCICILGSVQCYEWIGGCPGSANSWCYPQLIWSATARSAGEFYAPDLSSGTMNFHGSCGVGYCTLGWAFSVHLFL